MRINAILLLYLMQASQLSAHDIFEYQGGYNRTSGGAGIVMGAGGESLLQNPAQLWQNPASDFSFDIAPSKLEYSYTSPEPSLPVGRLETIAPLASVGASLKEDASSISFGLLFVPTGAGTANTIERFPFRVAGSYSEVKIEAEQTGFKSGLGFAYKFESDLRIGLGVLYDYGDYSTTIIFGEEALLQIKTKLRAIRTSFGFSYPTKLGGFGFIFHLEKKTFYALEAAASADGEKVQVFENDYRPRVFGLAYSSPKLFSLLDLYGQFTHENWVDATLVARSPNQTASEANPTPVEYLNTNNYVVGTRVYSGRDYFGISYSFYGANKGAGLLDDSGGTIMQGRNAQDFEALKREHVTFSYTNKSNSRDLLYYFSWIQGSAYSEENTPSEGFYELDIYMFGFSFVKKSPNKKAG